MKFKFKFSDLFLEIATVFVIILSIVLWIFIMTSDQRFSHINQTQPVRQQAKTRNSKSLYDLYIPTNAYGFVDGKLYRLYDSKNNLPFEFSKELQNIKVENKIKKVSSDRESYENTLNNPDLIQLSYPDEITFGLLTKFKMKKGNREFNRIFIPKTNKWLYLGNDQNTSLYRVSLKKANFNTLRHYVKIAKNKEAVDFVRLKSGYSAFYVKSENWNVYSYLTSTQSDSYFVSRLLGTSGVTSRTNKNGRTTYSYNYYTRLRVPKTGENNHHDYLYTHYEKAKVPTMTNQLFDSVYYVHRLGLTEQDLRFFDADKNSVRYTNYIEGIPVFLNDHDLQVDTKFSSDSVTISFNSTNFQIPIPFDGQTETLESTYDMISDLSKHGLHQSEIERIMVGFKVESDKSHNNLVNLVPTYYIKAFGQWKSKSEWLKEDIKLYQKLEENTENEVK
ncbi:hypothetical protein FOD82_00550 [Lactobacillus sp. LL6]|nr:hypothetical protein FOD82_00550 [Lactobacillus sp. LL6]